MKILKMIALNILVLVISILSVLVVLFVEPSFYSEDLNYLVGMYVVAIVFGIVTILLFKLAKKKIEIDRKWFILFFILNIALAETLFLLDHTRSYFWDLDRHRFEYEQASQKGFQGEDKHFVEKIYSKLPTSWKVANLEKRDGTYWCSLLEPDIFLGSKRYVGAYNPNSDSLIMSPIEELWEQLKKEKNLPETEQYSYEGGMKNLTFIAQQINHYGELAVQNNKLIVEIREGSPPKGEKK